MPDWKEFRDIFALSVPGCARADSGLPGLILAGASLRACWLGDSVGLVEDNRGSDHHDDGIGPWLHLVLPELLDLAIN